MEYSHQTSLQKSEKYDKTFGTKITVGLKTIGGMMLWVMSGTFNTNVAVFWPQLSVIKTQKSLLISQKRDHQVILKRDPIPFNVL